MESKELTTGVNVHKMYETLKQARLGINALFLKIGEILLWFHDKDRWKLIEGNDSTWTEFVSKLSIGRQHSYDLMALYREFVIRWQIPENLLTDTDRRNLISVLPLVRKAKDKDYVLEKVHQAKELSRSDLSIELKQEKNPDHKCDWEEYHYWKCKVCGDKVFNNPYES